VPGHYASFAYSDPFADEASLSLLGGRILDDSEDDTEQEEGGPPKLTTAQLARLRELVKNMPRFYGADESGMTAAGSTDPSGMEGADVEAAYTNYFEELKAYNATINQFLEDEGIPRFYKDDKGRTLYLNIGDPGQPSSFTDMYHSGVYDPQQTAGNYMQEGAVGEYGTIFDKTGSGIEVTDIALGIIAAGLPIPIPGLGEVAGGSLIYQTGTDEDPADDYLSGEGINPYLAYLTGKGLSQQQDEEEEDTTTVDATQGFLNTLNTAEEALQNADDEVTTATEALQESNESYDETIANYQKRLEDEKKRYGSFRAKNMPYYKRLEKLKKQAEIDKQTEATKLRQTIAAAITERDNARKAASNAEREYNEAVKLKQAEDIRQSQQDARDKIAGEKAAAEYSKALRQAQITATENTIKSNLPAYASSEEEIVDKLGERLYQSGMSLEQFIEAAYDIAFAGLRPDQISNAQRQKVRDIASSAYERVPKTTIVDVTEVTDDPVSEIIADADSSITEVEPTPETTLEDTTEPTETTVAFEDFEEPEFELDIEDPFITEPTESLLESTSSSDPSTEVTEVTIDEDPLLASTEELEVNPVVVFGEVEEPEPVVVEPTASSIPTVLEILSGTSGSVGGLGGSTGGAGMLGGSPEEGTVGTTTEDIVSGLEDSSVDSVGTTTTTGDTGVGSGTETIGTDVTEGIGTTTGTGVSEVGTTTGTGTGAGVGAGAGAGTGVGTTAGVETGAGVGTGTGVATGTGETSVPMAETGTGTTVETTEETDFSDIGEEAEESIFEDTTGETVEEVLEEAEEVLERTEEETTEAEETQTTGEEAAASGEGEATGEGTGTGQGSGAGEGLGAGLGAGLGLGLGIGLLRPGGVTQSLFENFEFTPTYQAPELQEAARQFETPNFLQGLFRDVA
jgi:hypothetical protein